MNTSILIVDDETDFLDSMSRLLRIEGYSDITAISRSADVPALLGDESKHFEVAFLDITMPDLDGFELLEMIMDTSPETECVMLTGNESATMAVRAARQGASDYLVKPILPEQVAQVLEAGVQGIGDSLTGRNHGPMG